MAEGQEAFIGLLMAVRNVLIPYPLRHPKPAARAWGYAA